MDLLAEMRGKGGKPDLSLYRTLIWGLCSEGKTDKARILVDEMNESSVKRNHIVYTTLIDAYFKYGKASKALGLFHKMRDSGMLLNGLHKEGYVREATYHGIVPYVTAYAALIDGLCKDGCLADAINIFEEMLWKVMAPDKVAFTSLMNGHLKLGNLKEALVLRDKMVETGFELDLHDYKSLIMGLL